MEEGREILKGLSVIVVTQNRIEYLQHLFISLDRELKTFNNPAEVIVIDNSNSKDSALISEMCKKYGYKFHFLGGSISEARNYGAKVAKFLIILFIDSDCEVVPGILREHVASYTEEDIGGVLGLTNFIGKENWVWKAIEKTSFHIAFSFAKRMDYALWGPCTNISFRKEVIEKVGGFRTEYPFDFSGEDVDIGLRINESGYKIQCNPNAIVNHSRETWSNFWKFCKKIFRWGRTDFHILKKHSYLSSIDFPKFTTILLFLFVLSIILKLSGLGWEVAELPIIWLFCVPFIETFLKTYRLKFASFLSNYLSFWLIFIFELGAVFESLKRGSPSMLYKKILYGKGEMIFEWDGKVIQSWSHILTFVIFLFILLLK
jgi:cellulose synthase/poly-beta-1,6-N-acetylglucosamine synthase-like glycosyltransferase